MPFNILFLSHENAARTIMAEALLNARKDSQFKAFSAGIRPADEVHPRTLSLLRNEGIDTRGLRPKPVTEFLKPVSPVMDLVFTISDEIAGEPRPHWRAEVTANWPIEQPAIRGDDAAFRSTYLKLNRLLTLLTRLSGATLERIALTWTADKPGAIHGRFNPDELGSAIRSAPWFQAHEPRARAPVVRRLDAWD